MKKIISIILALVMCFFAVAALASCGESAYDIAVKNGFKGTEEQWLQSLKGDAGAKGEDAAAPTIEIDKDGYWVINGVKTDVKATGDAGDKGSEGADGREVEFRKGTTHIQWRYKGEGNSLPTIDIKPIDTTGAGDAFFAGALTVLDKNVGKVLDSEVLNSAIKYGNITGALNTTGRGAIDNLPNLDTINKYLN